MGRCTEPGLASSNPAYLSSVPAIHQAHLHITGVEGTLTLLLTPLSRGQGTFRKAPRAAHVEDCQPCHCRAFCGKAGLAEPQGLCHPGHHCRPGSNTSSPVSAGLIGPSQGWSQRHHKEKVQHLPPEAHFPVKDRVALRSPKNEITAEQVELQPLNMAHENM
ncbi:hypothetical protein P7K49_029456 [Saguinus oedipus]|uniref:Uncharacterized protein n=1 Tax=Saguinus oedipus TaxID=9490 RepID=A0ABQ9U787_SAGOE|nr:hypothetical protein P7K49_029456 [Saguinus oedipus]